MKIYANRKGFVVSGKVKELLTIFGKLKEMYPTDKISEFGFKRLTK